MSLPLPHCAAIRRTMLLASVALTLTGCAVSRLTPSAASSSSGSKLAGSVHGGQQPVTGASIQLYAAGTGGNATASTPLLNTPVVTDANGNFSITGDYTCPTSSSQVYLAATGGNPGLPAGATNPALALVTALGNCGALTSSTNITLNEVTTVAAAWALAAFAGSLNHVASSSTNNAGLHNAFLTAGLLADTSSGISPAAALPANATVESAKIYTLANLLATCVNSNGGSLCAGIFSDATPSGAIPPTDTFGLALTIAANPSNVAALFNDIPPQTAFPNSLLAPPADWTLSIAYTGGGLNAPASLAVDATGNVWVASTGGTLSAFSPQGVPVWANGITGSGLDQSVSVAIDPYSNVWVANMASSPANANEGSLSELSSAGTSLAGSTGFTTGNINLPAAIAGDRNGNMWVANLGSSTVSLFSSAGTPLSGSGGFGGGLLAAPSALAVNPAHQVWVASRGNGTLFLLSSSGNVLHQTSLSSLPDSLAMDVAGNLWVGDNIHSTLAELDPNGNILAQPFTGGGLNRPTTLVADAASRLFATNSIANTFSAFAATSPLTPATGLGLDAHLNQPAGAGIDASGNLWITSLGDNRLVAFVGVATPTTTPKITLPRQP